MPSSPAKSAIVLATFNRDKVRELSALLAGRPVEVGGLFDLPGASAPAETGGTFTNTQKVIQEFAPGMTCRIEQNNLDQLTALLKHFGVDGQAIRTAFDTWHPAGPRPELYGDGRASERICDVLLQSLN